MHKDACAAGMIHVSPLLFTSSHRALSRCQLHARKTSWPRGSEALTLASNSLCMGASSQPAPGTRALQPPRSLGLPPALSFRVWEDEDPTENGTLSGQPGTPRTRLWIHIDPEWQCLRSSTTTPRIWQETVKWLLCIHDIDLGNLKPGGNYWLCSSCVGRKNHNHKYVITTIIIAWMCYLIIVAK